MKKVNKERMKKLKEIFFNKYIYLDNCEKKIVKDKYETRKNN